MLNKLRSKVTPYLDPVARAFAKVGFRANVLTVIGLVIGTIAAVVFGYGHERWGGLVLLICGFFDLMDGAVARVTRGETAFGGVLDSVVDRYVDAIVIIGIVYGGLAEAGGIPGWLWGAIALVGSIMVSYIRARGEAAGTGKLDVGIAERGERMLILAIGGLIIFERYAIVVVAILSNVTAIHRVLESRKRLR
jgi:archaetidylinositol phosphate synthase